MNMENLFENAYFGKAYKTRDGRKAIFIQFDTIIDDDENDIGHLAYVYTLRDGEYSVALNGISTSENDIILHNINTIKLDEDIVSEWSEEINDEKIVKKACKWLEEFLPNIEYIISSSALRLNKKEFIEQFKMAMNSKDEKVSVLSDALKYAKTKRKQYKRKQYKCNYYHELCSHCLNWPSPEDIDKDKADDCCSEYEMAAYYHKQDELRETGKCKYFVDF